MSTRFVRVRDTIHYRTCHYVKRAKNVLDWNYGEDLEAEEVWAFRHIPHGPYPCRHCLHPSSHIRWNDPGPGKGTLELADFDQPWETSSVQKAFPADALERMPPMDMLPDRHRDRVTGSWGEQLWNQLFAGVVDEDTIQLIPAHDVDAQKAWDHLVSIFGSFAPKHEHKMAALGYLTETWFEGGRWETTDGRPFGNWDGDVAQAET